ncbi:biliverdin-producing heme oxygenase [Rhodopirellula sp. JC740]|uniref:Biliverdin-producing heme oxygenase n=1 Tax=Rhodopirellula halodulae TaxID=2894198 RepID=A0ABS8NC15_9BACT|nr:biliverdin-producing heme oxygenase [Rhodopirellula sp. JC740]MCC9641073.1 biliverdin-producing heme oxygenase [Rhodopirellula sp. JC740]
MGIRQQLQQGTRELHQNLDAQMRGLGALNTLDGYQNFLRCMHRMQTHFAPHLAIVSRHIGLPDPTHQMRSAFAADFEALGISVEDPTDTPRVSTKPDPTPQQWGHAYAVEGSSLGGRYLLASVKKTMPDDVPTHYLTQLASGAKDRWPVFVDALETQTDLRVEDAISGAETVFRFVSETAQSIQEDSSHDSASQ